MSIRLDERRYAEELKRLVADFRMWKNPLVPLPDGFEDDLAWRSYRVFGQTYRLNPSKPSSQESRGFNHGSVKFFSLGWRCRWIVGLVGKVVG